MAKRGVYNRGGPYKMTARRRAALKKAQAVSAKKRRGQRNKRIGIAAGAIAGIAVAGFLGVKASNQIRGNRNSATAAVQPGQKEKTRTIITADARGRAQATRNALAPKPPRNRSSTRATNRATSKLVREHDRNGMDNITPENVITKGKKETTGRKSESLTGTPGGTKTTPKANPRASRSAWKDDDWSAALGFDENVRQPLTYTAPRHDSSFSSSQSQRNYSDAYRIAQENARASKK